MRNQVTCDETYIGAATDIARIAGILKEHRRQPLSPEYMHAHLRRVKAKDDLPAISTRLLSDFMENRTTANFDYAFFEHAIEHASCRVRELYPEFSPLPTDAYVVAEAVGNGLGGFHGQYGIGFQYESNFGFSELLNPSLVQDDKVRAIELARNYMHDSFHAASYRTFGYAEDALFRYQYGINFRLPSGISYSGTRHAPECTFVINLNTLMDGITTMVAADAVQGIVGDVTACDDLTRDVVQEIRGEYAGIADHAMARFANEVVAPAAAFVSYWGGESFRHAIGRAMLSGNIAPVKRHIEDAMASKAADRALMAYIEARRRDHGFLGRNLWQDLFLSVDFHHGLLSDESLHPLARYCGISLQ